MCFHTVDFDGDGDDNDDGTNDREGFLIVHFLRDALHWIWRAVTLIVMILITMMMNDVEDDDEIDDKDEDDLSNGTSSTMYSIGYIHPDHW